MCSISSIYSYIKLHDITYLRAPEDRAEKIIKIKKDLQPQVVMSNSRAIKFLLHIWLIGFLIVTGPTYQET